MATSTAPTHQERPVGPLLDPAVRAAVASRLVDRHAPDDPGRARTIEAWIDEDTEYFADARIRAFVPILIETRVRRRLQENGLRPGT
ncbi:MAG TPA: hypothetical protein VD814_09710 [Nocardioides sp.]|nr:hypothetical protein [Nocardioides sp.]